jgi:ATP-dependent Clp protease ATP-binding subunit ClpB
MNFDRYTQMSQQAVAAAQKAAESRSNPAIEPVHLLSSLIEEGGSPVITVLKGHKMLESVKEIAAAAIKNLPRVQGQVGVSLSNDLQRSLQAAEDQARNMGDSYITVEHLFLGLLLEGGNLATSLRQKGLRPDLLANEYKKLRGAQKADDPAAEEK